jgi:sulfate transport system ATP-binding protein
MCIDVIGITKCFGNYTALENIDLHVGESELLALLGPSGSGKTTLLRIIAGLEHPDEGRILFSGENALNRYPRDRRVGFVFQHYALFRHMTVFENVAFGLAVLPRSRRPSAAEIATRVDRLLNLVQLGWLADRYPMQLSGGQRQRVALARALAIEPRVLLLDEPFGALDTKVRKELRRWLRQLHDQMQVTSVFVTHDQEEALELADRVVVMSQGRIEQIGSPAEVYRQPNSAFVYTFLGDVVYLPCWVEDGRVQLKNVPLVLGSVENVTGPATAYVRPHDIELVPSGTQTGSATIMAIHAIGALVRIELDLADIPVEAVIPQGHWDALELCPGARVDLHVRRAMMFSDRETETQPQPLHPFPSHRDGSDAAPLASRSLTRRQ